jgi:hypothetical protein
MSSTESTIKILEQIYDPPESIYTPLIPFLIVLFVFLFTMVYLMKININISRSEWTNNKCVPKYMFISGFIENNKEHGNLKSTYINFKECIKKISLKYKPK